jgi:(1->4)-alpha-D-glucan 1-alpha-D-glucosylmutase
MQRRHEKWPFGMNATMTHDAKRAEDARARISVLSELPAEWASCLNRWSQWNDSKCRQVRGVRVPERNEETLLYQTLLGSWPIIEPACACYTRRIQDFMVKAVREAMVHTRWMVPNLDHEQALVDFVRAVLEETPNNKFLRDLSRFATKIAYHGALNSLSQLAIKLASPGVADFYQGTELWDLRLVDPDNRKPVDFGKLETLLASPTDRFRSLPALVQNWKSGRIKLHVTQQGLCFRQRQGALLLKGSYIPLQTVGAQSDCVLAFARRYRGNWAIVMAPRFTVRLAEDDLNSLNVRGWKDTRILLPKDAPKCWANIFSGEPTTPNEAGELYLEEVFDKFPVALLFNQPECVTP